MKFNQKLPTEKTSPLKNEMAGFKKVAAGRVDSTNGKQLSKDPHPLANKPSKRK